MPSKKAKKANLPLAMSSGNTVDIFRSRRIANIFFFFVSAAKASLLPFLTVYFRLLGLSPIQTGIIFGSQSIVMAIMVPFWLKMSYLCNQKKMLMLFSIFILIVSNLLLTAVPPTDRDQSMLWCPDYVSNHSLTGPGNENVSDNTTTTDESEFSNTTDLYPTNTSEVIDTTLETFTESETGVSTTILPTMSSMDTSEFETTSDNTEHGADILPAEENDLQAENDTLTTESPTDAPTRRRHRPGENHATNTHHRNKRSLSDKISQIQSQVYAINHRTFILVLFIIIVGEILSCAAEKFADDAWFTLLDSVDDVEKYGSHKYWSAIAYIFYAVIVALVVDTRECFLSLRIHHFMIHFYVFAGLLIIAFFTGIFYPFYPRDRPSRHHVQRSKARILCSDLRSFFYVVTILLMGCVNASVTCFLFWRIQDVGGTETQMGVVIMLRAITELLMLIFGKQIIQRLGIPLSTVLGMLAMVGRLVYFSFLWTSWAVVPIELLYGLSNCLLWQAICAHPDFSLNIVTRRVTQNIFHILYYGVGASIGCIIAGYGYGLKSLPLVYQSWSIVVGLWCLLFGAAQRCLPKPPQVKYARLLADDEDSQSESDEDDWLEMALKNH